MNTTEIARNIQGAMQPLMGPAATGQLLVLATGSDAPLPKGAKAVPVVGDALLEQGMVFVRANPASPDGAWTVTAAGTLVAVEALHGGSTANLPAGTDYRWDPPLAGIEATSAAEAPGITGGSFHTTLGALRQARMYRELARVGAETFFRAQLSEFPGVALAWESTTPLDGALAAAPGPRTARVGRGRFLSRDTWILWIVTSRLDSTAARSQEADELRDLVIDTLLDARCVRGVLPVSQSPGATLLDARVFAVFPTSYVDVVRFGTVRTRQRIDTATYNPWLRTRIRQQTEEQAGDKLDLPDYTVPME